MPDQDNNRTRSLFSGLRDLFRRSQPENAAETSKTYTERALAITDANRAELIRFAENAPIAYGNWAELKRLYKEAERTGDEDILATLIARLDTISFPSQTDRLRMADAPLSNVPLGTISHIRVEGSYAYLLSARHYNTSALKIIDISDPVQPRLAARLSTPQMNDLVLRGNQAFAVEEGNYGGTTGGLHLLDVSQPEIPQVTATIRIGRANAIAFLKPCLLILTGRQSTTSLVALDIANPESPVTLSETKVRNIFSFQVEGRKVVAISGELYQAESHKLLVYDFTDPRQPRALAEHRIAWPAAVKIVGDYAYVLSAAHPYYRSEALREGLYVYNLATGRPAGYIAIARGKSIAVQGRYVYIGVEPTNYGVPATGGLRIVDVSDPAIPKLAGTLPGGSIIQITVEGNRALLAMQASAYSDATLRIADVSDPTQPILLGAVPSRQTLAYMKRRARRALRTLALQDPTRYIVLISKILMATGRGRTELDTQHQWVTMDILFGNSTRYEQTSHGRGGYVRHDRFSLRRREERHPELWDRFPGLAQMLLTTADLPWQMHETALKVSRGQRMPLPELSDASLARFFQSPSSLLRVIAARTMVERFQQNPNAAPDLVAEAFYRGSGRARAIIRRTISEQTEQGKLTGRWTNPFATRLSKLASDSVTAAPLSRRQAFAFGYLVTTFPTVLGRQMTPELVMRLYATRRPEMMAWAMDAIRQATAPRVQEWLHTLEPLAEDLRATAVTQLTTAMSGMAFTARQLKELLQHPSDWIRVTAWNLVAASATNDDTLLELWNTLLEPLQVTDALRTAMASPSAIALFNRLPFDGPRWQTLLATRPFLVGLLPQSALASVVRVLPPETVVRLVMEVSDDRWPELRGLIVSELRQSGRLNAFWQSAWKQINATGNPILTTRLLDDSELAATFLEVESADYLDAANPVFGALLGRWARAHETFFTKDSSQLLKAATHMLPEVRAFGLERVRTLGMGIPFALRLLESEMPPAVEAGHAFFESVTEDKESEIEFAIVLCDSPKASVRAYGRRYLDARRELLPTDLLLARLTEHPDPQMQAFVAEKLAQSPNMLLDDGTVTRFDRQVLRTRDRSRRAKELIKQRRDKETLPDVAALLELARSQTPRDAAWALGQLARLALEGVEIEGFTLEGVAGG